MKTRFALAFYYISIGFLVIGALVIIAKLMLWPPCTPTGNICVIEPWSVAGLAGTVLAVAATVLAILGAVAVAAWWTSLNERVTDQVKGLYQGHKKEIGKELDDFIAEQQRAVSDQFDIVQIKLQEVESRIANVTSDIDELEGLTTAFIDLAADGIISDLISTPNTWDQKVATLRKFPKMLVRMSMVYIGKVEKVLPSSEKSVLTIKNQLSDYYADLQQMREAAAVWQEISDLKESFRQLTHKYTSPSVVLSAWEKALSLRDIVGQAGVIPLEDIDILNSKISAYQFRIDQLKISYEQTKEQVRQFYEQIDPVIEAGEAKEDAERKALEAETEASDSRV